MMYENNRGSVGCVRNTYVSDHYTNSTSGVRPVVSLKPGTAIEPDGTGSVNNPYIVK